jgi:hypothetical protein
MSVPPWVTTPGPGGLVRIAWVEGDKQRVAIVRVEQTGEDRLRIAELHLREPTPVGLRELRLGAIERLVNSTEIRAAVFERMDDEAPDVFGAFAGITVTGKARLEARVTIRTSGVVLERPTGRKLGDDFYREVLRAYDEATRKGLPVMRTLVEASGAPRNTVARWLKEARRRERLWAQEAGA